jgi:hypothetical protein
MDYCDIEIEDLLFIGECISVMSLVMLACFAGVLTKKIYTIQRQQLPR